jgi:23S rRNA (uracil1939-C5)-methyltransferase
VPYEEQRRLKRAALQAALEAALGASAPEAAPVLAPDGNPGPDAAAPWAFRYKVHFVCAPSPDGRLVLGHFAAGSQRVVAVETCSVHADAGNRAAARVRDLAQQVGVPAATIDGSAGLLRHIVARVSRATGEVLLTLVVTNGRDPRLRQLVAALVRSPDAPAGIHVNVLRGRSSMLFGPETRRAAGRSWLSERVAGVVFLVGPTSFFQTNVEAAETLVATVLQEVPRQVRDVLDLYAGAGLFALPLARRGHRVVAVEENPAAVDAGRRGLSLNRLDERACRFVRAPVERALGHLDFRGGRTSRQSRVVILDPPRGGCAPRVLRRLARDVQPARVIYVSCNVTALARDLALFLDAARAAGAFYAIPRVQPIDMFPHTPHLEAVAVLERRDASDRPLQPARAAEPGPTHPTHGRRGSAGR